jgi:hypothetical protein
MFNSRFYQANLQGCRESTLSLAPPTVLCRDWDSSGSFKPKAVSLVMALKQLGLGFKIFLFAVICSYLLHK